MSNTSPPLEAQRFGRSQTPESPRPVHLPEPSNIPVLMNQMDPVFNDTATYNIPSNQNFSPYSDSNRALHESTTDEHDAVQNFLRGAEEENARNEDGADFIMKQEQFVHDPSLLNSQTQLQAVSSSNSSLAQPSQAFDEPSIRAQNANDIGQDTMEPEHVLGNAENLSKHPEPVHMQSNDLVQSSDTQINGPNPTTHPIVQKTEEGVDYQSLLDTISQSASTAPAAENITAPTTAASHVEQEALSLPSIPGLPPKPPPQANAPDFPSYPIHQNTDAYPPFMITGGPGQYSGQGQAGKHSSSDVTNLGPTNPTILSQNGLSFPTNQAPSNIIPAPGTQLSPSIPLESNQIQRGLQVPSATPSQGDPTERPWTPKTQSLYDQFLEDERRYVTEGIWDRFPVGSRLFVGNLPSEKVTKRDLFHTFHRHGRLAQISIKQAYGFVQYLDSAACYNALTAEQGVEIRGRKIHLEISKPQKNTRNAGGANNKSSARRRSRSPDRGVTRSSNDRHSTRPPFSDFRDEPGRRRDDYRPVRSPSPRGYRSREDTWPHDSSSRGYGAQDGRPRSPAYGTNFSSPAFDDDATLPLPRRDLRSVPDVQILILDPQVAQGFINWVEQGFQSKSLRASTIWLSARLPLAAVVKRQIIEGVQAVVKLTQSSQFNSKIPLQVFDRTAGASNVNFNEYVDLDVPVAADIVIHARQKERGSLPPTPSSQYPPVHGYGNPPQQYVHPPMQQQHTPLQYPPPTPPQYAHQPPAQLPYQNQQTSYRPQPQSAAAPNTNPPNLQQLLANLRQPSDSQMSSQTANSMQNGRPTDLSGILSNIAARQQPPNQQYNSGHNQQPHQPSNQMYGNLPAAQAYGSGQQQQHQNVQNIMEQLARYNR